MEITWLGHSCFRLRSRDLVVVTDPYGGEDWGYPPLRQIAADIVTISHDHPHHANLAAFAGQPRVLKGPGEYEIGGAIIWGVRTGRREHGPDGAERRARNVSYALQLENLRVCHLGDLGSPLTAEQLTVIKDSDVLFVPVGGHCTISPSEAAEIVAQIEPKVVVPMHYATSATEGALELEGIERFCREMGATSLVPQARLNVTPSSLPSEPTVVVLEQRS